MEKNLKASIEPSRVSKRIAEAKRMVNPIVAVEARHKRNPKVAGSEGIRRKTKVPKIAQGPRKILKKIKTIKEASENEVLYTRFCPYFSARINPKPNLKRGKRPLASEVTQTDISYKALYIVSQKKVEDLTEENYKQAIDLSYRSGQVDAYEYIIGNMKNVVAFSNITRVTDAEMNLSEGTAPDAPSLNANTELEPSRMKKNIS